jgi:hypothetical protein
MAQQSFVIVISSDDDDDDDEYLTVDDSFHQEPECDHSDSIKTQDQDKEKLVGFSSSLLLGASPKVHLHQLHESIHRSSSTERLLELQEQSRILHSDPFITHEYEALNPMGNHMTTETCACCIIL